MLGEKYKHEVSIKLLFHVPLEYVANHINNCVFLQFPQEKWFIVMVDCTEHSEALKHVRSTKQILFDPFELAEVIFT